MKFKTIKLIAQTLLVGGTIATAELLLMGPIMGPMFALSTFGGVAWCLSIILLPEGTEGSSWQ